MLVNRGLQIIVIILAVLFLIYIIKMICKGKLELKYSLTWLLTGIVFITMSLYPKLLNKVANLLYIISPMNALFFIVIGLLLIIIFTLTVTISKYKKQITSISQELGILKEEFERGEKK